MLATILGWYVIVRNIVLWQSGDARAEVCNPRRFPMRKGTGCGLGYPHSVGDRPPYSPGSPTISEARENNCECGYAAALHRAG